MALDSDKLAGVFSSRLLAPYSRSYFDLLLSTCGKFRWLLVYIHVASCGAACALGLGMRQGNAQGAGSLLDPVKGIRFKPGNSMTENVNRIGRGDTNDVVVTFPRFSDC